MGYQLSNRARTRRGRGNNELPSGKLEYFERSHFEGLIVNTPARHVSQPEKSPASLDRFLRAILHGIKLALTNPDMAKKAISRNMRLTDSEAVTEVYQRT